MSLSLNDHQIVELLMRNESILFVIGSLEIGGSEKHLTGLVKGLHSKGMTCHVFSLQRKGPLRIYLERHGVLVYEAGLRKRDFLRAPWRLFAAQLKLITLIRKANPVVVHAFLPLVTFMGALAGRMCKVPLVVTSRRALGTHQERYRFLRPFDLLANYLSHKVTVNSMAVWNDVVQRDHIDPGKLFLIYNAIDPEPFEMALHSRGRKREELGLGPDSKVVTVVANLIPYKGHSELFKAIRLVKEKVPEIALLVVGEDRGIGNQLKHEAEWLGIRLMTKFLGQRLDIPELLAASDISVLSSHEEGFSNVILESMAAGLPVVATDVGGNSEAIVDGVTGWLVPPKNPVAMARKIIDLLSNPAKARVFGEKGKKRVSELFTIERMVKEHLRLYRLEHFPD